MNEVERKYQMWNKLTGDHAHYEPVDNSNLDPIVEMNHPHPQAQPIVQTQVAANSSYVPMKQHVLRSNKDSVLHFFGIGHK